MIFRQRLAREFRSGVNASQPQPDEQVAIANRFAVAQFLELLNQPKVTDVVANGASRWLVNRGDGFTQLTGITCTSSDLARLCRELVDLADRHLDLANPICDVSLTSRQLPRLAAMNIHSLRVHAVLESSVSPSTLLSVRVHREGFTSLSALKDLGMFNNSQESLLRQIINNRENFLIAGPAGSGKTTLLRAMLAQTPQLRTVLVEDTAELLPIPGHAVGLQARQSNIDGRGEISLQVLSQQALRMQPQRLVIGEVRGPEVLVLLQAMNTGHAGSAATIHANSAQAVYPRLRGLALNAEESAFRQLAKSAIQKVIFLSNHTNRNVSWIGDFQC